MRLDDPRLANLAAATRGLSAMVSFVEANRPTSSSSSAPPCWRAARSRVHRKLFLPTYGLFDERQFFAAGDLLRAVDRDSSVRLGIAVCEDFWHLAVPRLLAFDGAQILVNVSSPGPRSGGHHEVGLGTATSWRTLMRTYLG